MSEAWRIVYSNTDFYKEKLPSIDRNEEYDIFQTILNPPGVK